MPSKIYVSECGGYLAVPAEGQVFPAYDVVERAGKGVWLWPRENGAYPEREHMCGYWGRPMHMKPFEKYEHAFELGISDHDTSAKIKPLMGNTITRNYPNILFRKRVPESHARAAKAKIAEALAGQLLHRAAGVRHPIKGGKGKTK